MTRQAINDQPDRKHLKLLDNVTYEPVFIMGDHRSGTTLLYQLLGNTGQFNVMTAYHVICYGELLAHYTCGSEAQARGDLAERFARLGVADRVIDGVKVTPDMPEEYGFVLRNRGFKAQVGPQNLAQFEELCRKVQYISQPGRPLLLKNPWDALNFMYIKQICPGARFVFIHRHPLGVINSQIKALRSMMAERNEYVAMIAPWYDRLFQQPVQLALARLAYSPRLGLGLRTTVRHVSLVTSYYLDHIDGLSPADYIAIRYEDLCARPANSLHDILAFLKLPAEVPEAVTSLIQPREPRLLAEIERNRVSIARRLAAYYRRMEYPSD